MKRVFIIFSLLFCLGVTAPMAIAADSFDANLGLSENLEAWTEGSKSMYFHMEIFGSESLYDATLIYSSEHFMQTRSYNENMETYNGFRVFESVKLNTPSSDMITRFVAQPEYQLDNVHYYMFFGSESLTYEWDGQLIDVVPGSVFMSFCLGGPCYGMDMVVLLTPAGSRAVPVPAAALLLGSGLAGLAALRRKMA